MSPGVLEFCVAIPARGGYPWIDLIYANHDAGLDVPELCVAIPARGGLPTNQLGGE
jgi:hypothetical protein